jgi:hypothetical protein
MMFFEMHKPPPKIQAFPKNTNLPPQQNQTLATGGDQFHLKHPSLNGVGMVMFS